jgi:dihydrofolate reductase
MLIYSMSVSADGVIADRDGAFGWSAPSEELFRFHLAQVRELGGFLCGRRLYETMLVWETDPSMRDSELDAALADAWCEIPKVVFSRTLDSVQGNARLAETSVAEAAAATLDATDNDVGIGGAGELNWRRDAALALGNSTALAHQLEVNEFFSRLADEARLVGEALREWWGERRLREKLGASLIPDGYGRLERADGSSISFLLELDRGTERPIERLRDKANGAREEGDGNDQDRARARGSGNSRSNGFTIRTRLCAPSSLDSGEAYHFRPEQSADGARLDLAPRSASPFGFCKFLGSCLRPCRRITSGSSLPTPSFELERDRHLRRPAISERFDRAFGGCGDGATNGIDRPRLGRVQLVICSGAVSCRGPTRPVTSARARADGWRHLTFGAY